MVSQKNKISPEKVKNKANNWSCGCTAVICFGELNAGCLKCGTPFARTGGADRSALLVNSLEEGPGLGAVQEKAGPDCDRCSDEGFIKAYTQEWDRIKCHQVPCPMCRSKGWSAWSADKKIIMIK